MTTGKRCSGCGELKALSEFSLNSDNTDGRQSNCKVCDVIIGRSNRWKREHNVGERQMRYVLEQVQHDTCPLCFRPLHWRDVGMALRYNRETGELYGFTHDGCRESTTPEHTWSAFIDESPFCIGNDYVPFFPPPQPRQESLL